MTITNDQLDIKFNETFISLKIREKFLFIFTNKQVELKYTVFQKVLVHPYIYINSNFLSVLMLNFFKLCFKISIKEKM